MLRRKPRYPGIPLKGFLVRKKPKIVKPAVVKPTNREAWRDKDKKAKTAQARNYWLWRRI